MLQIPGVDRITETGARLTVSVGYEDGKQSRNLDITSITGTTINNIDCISKKMVSSAFVESFTWDVETDD